MSKSFVAPSDTLTATEARAAIGRGELSATEYADQLLARISACDADVKAWTTIEPEAVRAQAKALDEAQANGAPLGPLHGIPVGIKDIIATHDLLTQNGSDHFIGHQPETDAAVVAILRSAGAIIMGKTVTTELATRSPGKTHNPHNLDHTPGGSSSGSAAAVAAGMVPLALGTQTGGSVVRPASYCGIHGLKPTRGLIPRGGVTLQSHTLDTVGTYGRSLEDVALLTQVLDRWDGTDDVSYRRGESQLAAELESGLPQDAKPRFAFVRTPNWNDADAATQSAIEKLVKSIPAEVTEPSWSPAFARVSEHHQIIQAAENSHHFAPLMARDPSRFTDGLRQSLEAAEHISAKRYQEAVFAREPLYREMASKLEDCDALITLSSPGSAPMSLASTGNPIFNGLWTYLGVPTITLPMMTVDGLPCGVTLVGLRRGENHLLSIAQWYEANVAPVS
ncbi:MAG: amidase [Pseudomonadota bacterium]